MTEGVTSSLQVLANEPSLGLYRMEEHVVCFASISHCLFSNPRTLTPRTVLQVKAVPELVKTKQEIVKLTGIVHGACHDVEYALTTVQAMQKISSFESLQAHTEKAIEYQQKIRRMHQAANQKKQDARAGARSPDLIEPTGAFSASLRTGMTPTDNSNEDGGAPTGAVQNDAVDGEGAADGADPTDDDALVSPKKKKKKKKAKEIVTKSFS